MADLSFNIVALDKAGATFIKLAEQVDKLSEKLERLDGKNVTADVNIRTDNSRKALDSFTTRYQLMAAGIAAASPAIGASIVAGVGVGFIGVAAIAQSSNQQVQEAYKGLWQDVVATTQNATDQLVPQLVGAADQMDATVQRLGPSIEHAFSFAGPSIVALTHGIDDAATNAMPGLTSAMQNSLPVMEGAAALMGQVGTAGGQAFADLAAHSQSLGSGLQSFGSIVSSVLDLTVGLVTDVADAWAASAGSINGAVSGVADTITGLAQGALPAFTAALGAAAALLDGVTTILGPLAPILGFVGAAALATWAAFKLAGVATVGVKALAMGIVTLGGNMEAAGARTGVMIAGMRGVSVAASTTAATVTAASRATATAAVTMGASVAAIAGPLGIVLVAGAALYGLFASSQDDAADSARNLAANVDTVTSALVANHGVANQTVTDAIKQTDAFKAVSHYAGELGITQAEIANDATHGAVSLRRLRDQLVDVAKGFDENSTAGAELAERYKPIIEALNQLIGLSDKTSQGAQDQADANEKVARTTIQTAEFQSVAASSAQLLGLALGAVTGGYVAVVAGGNAASSSVQDVSAAFIKSALTVAQSQQSIVDHFQSADRAVEQAQQALADANHSAASSSRAVVDASRGVATAQRSLADATAGVATAQTAYVRAQEQERVAQAALHTAREQAIRDLKELHLQMADQEVTEQQARLRLFDATRDAAGLGVTVADAQKIAMQKVTQENEPQIKAALELLSAQNSLNNTLNSGKNLREQVAAADKAGIDGSKGVVSAQSAVKGAHEQVISASVAVAKAQQQVTDAAYGLQRAQQSVTDAEYSRARASDRVRQAQMTLSEAQSAASRTLDINTKAGQGNLNMLLSLWAAIQATGMPIQDRYQAMVNNTATAMGLSTGAAAGYLKQLGLIPRDFKYKVTAVAGADLQEITQTTVNGVKIFQSSLGLGGIASAGRLASGGPVAGVGGPREDANLIWASRGEYMQPADVVDHYGVGVMEAMRSKRLKVMDGADFPGYAAGGLIDAIAAYTNLSTAYVTDVNTLGVMGMKRPAQLPKYVAPVMPSAPGGGIAGYTPGSGVAQWTSLVLRALAELSQPASLLPNVLRRMNQESGGNPRAINLWDSNAKKGTPSIGLMQTIQPTFNRWAGPYGARGIYDPLANIYAGLNYAIHRYPSLRYAMDKPGGYKNGGWLMPGQMGVNETSVPEAVLTQEQLAKLDRPNVTKNFNLHAHVTNRPVDLVNEFRRIELSEGLLW